MPISSYQPTILDQKRVNGKPAYDSNDSLDFDEDKYEDDFDAEEEDQRN